MICKSWEEFCSSLLWMEEVPSCVYEYVSQELNALSFIEFWYSSYFLKWNAIVCFKKKRRISSLPSWQKKEFFAHQLEDAKSALSKKITWDQSTWFYPLTANQQPSPPYAAVASLCQPRGVARVPPSNIWGWRGPPHGQGVARRPPPDVENLENPPFIRVHPGEINGGYEMGPGLWIRFEVGEDLGEVNNKTGDGGCRSRPLEMSGFITSRPNLICNRTMLLSSKSFSPTTIEQCFSSSAP